MERWVAAGIFGKKIFVFYLKRIEEFWLQKLVVGKKTGEMIC